MAGKRKGKEDERHLWPEMLRAIREIKPKYIVGENVFGLLNWNGGLVFDEVHTDLELEGYEVQAVVIPAAAVNAPHGRDRVWFVAYSNGIGNRGESKQPSVTHKQRRCGKTDSGIGSSREQQPLCDITSKGNVTNSKCDGLQYGNKTSNIRSTEEAPCRKGRELTNVIKTNGQNEYVTDSNAWRLQRGNDKKKNKQPVDRNTWDIFPTQSPICGGDDGIPTKLDGITFSKWRVESIKGYGNAIVPQVAYEIFKVLQHIDDSLK